MSSSVLHRSFTNREKTLIIVLVALLLVACYYFFVIRNVEDTKAANELALSDIQVQIDTQNAISQVRGRMESELNELGTLSGIPEVAVYDNLRNELDELNRILLPTTSSDLKFSTPEVDGSTIRRVVTLTFETATYDQALAIVEQLQNGKYRCDVTDFALQGTLAADGSVQSVHSTLKLTYFETATGAESLSGTVEK